MPPSPRVEASAESTSLLDYPSHFQMSDNDYSRLDQSDESVTIEGQGDSCCGLHAVWHRYNDLLEQHPLLVKSITAMIILGGADLCGQGVEHIRGHTVPSGGVDWPRMARFASFGFFGAPWSHYYFYYLDHYLPPSPKPCSFRTFLKVGIDQGIQAPGLLLLMIGMLSVMKGESWRGVQHDVSTTYWTALVANWRLWIPFSLLNIACVRPSLRVLFVNVVFFFWTIILSLMLNSTR